MNQNQVGKITPFLRPGIIFVESKGECDVVDLIDFRNLKMNSSALQMLKLCNGRHSLEDIVSSISKGSSNGEEMRQSFYDFFFSLLEKDVVLTDRPKYMVPSDVSKHGPPGVVFLEMTKGCNLRCVWCYNNAQTPLKNELTTDQWKKCIDRLSGNECTLIFTGGEALTRKDLFEIADHAKQLGFKTQLFTNGTLIDPQKAREIAHAFDYVRITIDGATASTNDFIRGTGGFKRAINGMQLLVDKGVPVCWQTIVSQHNLHELSMIPEKAIELGASGLRMASVDPIGRGSKVEDLQLSHAQEFVFWSFVSWAMEEYKSKIQIDWGADYCLEEAWETVMSIKPGEAPSATPEGRRNPQYYMKFVKTSQCGVGTRSFLINPQGFIGLCPLLAPPEIILGNVFENDILDVWHNNDIFKTFRNMTLEDYDDCSGCGFRYRCLGGCRGRAYNFQKSLKGCDKKMLKYFNVPK
jgi:radical SAM protein with 4Fe4S-binding SPASM domain